MFCWGGGKGFGSSSNSLGLVVAVVPLKEVLSNGLTNIGNTAPTVILALFWGAYK
jgi:hypothetical protein